MVDLMVFFSHYATLFDKFKRCIPTAESAFVSNAISVPKLSVCSFSGRASFSRLKREVFCTKDDFKVHYLFPPPFSAALR